ncbi:MAG: GNAT family N-acetyltransferase [Acidimicrobiales bacterium]
MAADKMIIDMENVRIRLAQAGDAAELTKLARDSYRQYVAAEGSEPEPMKTDYQTTILLGDTWVAEYQDEIFGLLVLQPRSNYLLLDNIAVDEAVRGCGLGRRLMDWSESRAIELGLSEIHLYTGAVMTQNRYYYESRGYEETHRAFDGGHHRIYYTKTVRL